MRTQREVVVLVAREARQVEHDYEVDAALVQPTEGQQILKLAAIRGLGALAFLVEPFENASGSTLVTIGGRCDRIRPVTVTWLPRLS